MKRFKAVATGAAIMTLSTLGSANAAFVIGGENGWQLSTDGIVDVFDTYMSASAKPGGNRSVSFLNGGPGQYQANEVTVGLLPSVVAFNVKAPTVNGVESSVRIGIYPSIQNSSSGGAGVNNRFNTSPNIDFREIFYTAKGQYGEILAGRALNLYQGKSILNDMTLLTAGVVPAPGTTTTLGHIGYGYLYTNFSAQLRYTTPDFSGLKVSFELGEPYMVSAQTAKTPMPRFETEISYATTLGKDNNLQAWLSGLYQGATRGDDPLTTPRPGGYERSVGGDAGVTLGIGGVQLHASTYVGEGLGMISTQDGGLAAGALGGTNSNAVDGSGCNRTQFGFLAQATYQLNPEWKLGVNYGQNRQIETDYDKSKRSTYTVYGVPMFKQEAVDAMVVYNLTKFIQFVAEYAYAQNTWADSATQHSNSISFGTMYYW
jgi:hypothetical protein